MNNKAVLQELKKIQESEYASYTKEKTWEYNPLPLKYSMKIG